MPVCRHRTQRLITTTVIWGGGLVPTLNNVWGRAPDSTQGKGGGGAQQDMESEQGIKGKRKEERMKYRRGKSRSHRGHTGGGSTGRAGGAAGISNMAALGNVSKRFCDGHRRSR